MCHAWLEYCCLYAYDRELTDSPYLAPGLLPAFFTAQINNDHTRKAYLNAARRFAEWCDANGLDASGAPGAETLCGRPAHSTEGL